MLLHQGGLRGPHLGAGHDTRALTRRVARFTRCGLQQAGGRFVDALLRWGVLAFGVSFRTSS